MRNIELKDTTAHPDCNGLCASANDLGVGECGGNKVAYAHPACTIHGEGACAFCEGWGNYQGRDSEEGILTCVMCEGTGKAK